MFGLAASCGVEVLAHAVGVDEPGRYCGGVGDGRDGDRGAGGLEGVDGGQGAAAFVGAVLGAGGAQPGGAFGCGGHPAAPGSEVVLMRGSCRAARARRMILLACSTSSRSPGGSSSSRRRILSATSVKARISAPRLSIT